MSLLNTAQKIGLAKIASRWVLACRKALGKPPEAEFTRHGIRWRLELREEIEFEMPEATRFTQFDFDFSPLGYPKVYRIYFEVQVPDAAFRRFVLHEGADVQAFRGENLLVTRRVTPYDAFAVWMHLNRQRSLPAR
ncbi:MAG: hypothetical protein AABM64_00440 [Pseudomonadota bacterium]